MANFPIGIVIGFSGSFEKLIFSLHFLHLSESGSCFLNRNWASCPAKMAEARCLKFGWTWVSCPAKMAELLVFRCCWNSVRSNWLKPVRQNWLNSGWFWWVRILDGFAACWTTWRINIADFYWINVVDFGAWFRLMAGAGYSTNSRFCRNSRMEWVGKCGAKGPFQYLW